MSYVYKGPQPVTKIRADGAVIRLKPCGTDAAYKRHLSNGEIACDQCLTAHRVAIRKWDRKANTRPRRKLSPCGTAAAYRRHQRRKESIDQACREANNKQTRDRRAHQKAGAA